LPYKAIPERLNVIELLERRAITRLPEKITTGKELKNFFEKNDLKAGGFAAKIYMLRF
jgi:hypothetical protein